MVAGLKYVKYIKGEVNGQLYEPLLEYCFDCCDSFSLITQEPSRLSLKGKAVINGLKDHEVEVIENVTNWPGTDILPAAYINEKGEEQRIIHSLRMYKCDIFSLKILLDSSRCLYDWELPRYPGDITFYRYKETPFLISTSHKETCRVEATDLEMDSLIVHVPGLILQDII